MVMFNLKQVFIIVIISFGFTTSVYRPFRGDSLLNTRSSLLYSPRSRLSWKLAGNPSLQNLESNQRCRPLRPVNGKSRSRQKGRFAMFMCNQGYQLVGSKHAVCEAGEWDVEAPVCVKNGCQPLPKPEHGVIYHTNGKSVALLFCDPGYEIDGPTMVYCNGQMWNGTFSECTETYKEPELSCDFENEDICGWTHDPTHDFDWRRHNYTTPSNFVGTGPQHDHTLGANKGGHYMYIESSSRIENQTARLFSPLYRGNLSDGCFVFFYHMYGRSIGSLNVYMKPEGVELKTVLEDPDTYRMFEKSQNQGNVWLMGFFYLNTTAESFQIIIEGVNGPSYASDIAIDDVEILQEPMCANISSLQINSPEEEGGYIDIQSCANRCDTYGNLTSTVSQVMACDCTLDCDETSSCCLDYLDLCVFDSSSVTEISTELSGDTGEYTVSPQESTHSTKTTTIQTTELTTETTNKITTRSTNLTTISTTQVMPITNRTIKTTISTTFTPKTTLVTGTSARWTQPSATKLINSTTITTVKKNIKPKTTSIPKRTSTATSITVQTSTIKLPEYPATVKQITESEEKPTGAFETMTDYLEDQFNREITEPKQQLITEEKQSTIGILLVVCGIILAGLIVVLTIYRYRRRSFQYKNPKSRSRQNCCRGADEEFSEVRFLTADEQLDFTLASPDGD